MSLAAVVAPPLPGTSWRGLRVAERASRPATGRTLRMPTETDADLVVRARAGDMEAFRTLVERYQDRIFWVARGMLGNDEDARDTAQEAFIRVHRSLDRFDTRLKFYTWLYQIVVNLCIDHMRKHSKRKGVSLDVVGEVPGDGESRDPLESGELKQRVQRVLDELPPKYKAVMVLSDLQGIGAKEIATMTGTTHATVRWRHHRARKLFREAWERIYGKGSHVL